MPEKKETKKSTSKKKSTTKKKTTAKSTTKATTAKKSTAKKATATKAKTTATKTAAAQTETAPAKAPAAKAAPRATKKSGGKLRVRQIRSTIHKPKTFKRTLVALGLRHHQAETVVQDSPSTRGMLIKVRHLVSVTPEDA